VTDWRTVINPHRSITTQMQMIKKRDAALGDRAYEIDRDHGAFSRALRCREQFEYISCLLVSKEQRIFLGGYDDVSWISAANAQISRARKSPAKPLIASH
jgi:hypothetical protein